MKKSVEDFIRLLKILSGTGNGIGTTTIIRLEKIAIEHGYIKKV